MTKRTLHRSRRAFIRSLAATGLAAGDLAARLPNALASPGVAPIPQTGFRTIPSSGESIPCIGMGTWLTFDVPADSPAREQRVEVLRAFLEGGGGLLDSSPMYGHAEDLIGYALKRIDAAPTGLFAASKIWTPIGALTGSQLLNSETLMGTRPMDLMQVHNLLNLPAHLPKLQAWKKEGRIRHVGVTTSHGRRHDDLETVLAREPLDFVQLTYHMRNRAAEERLLSLAQDRGIAVIVNRPLERGALIDRYGHRPLPGLARELGCQSWAQLFLLWIVSHPAVTTAIPATTRVDHVRENLAVASLETPDQKTRDDLSRALQD